MKKTLIMLMLSMVFLCVLGGSAFGYTKSAHGTINGAVFTNTITYTQYGKDTWKVTQSVAKIEPLIGPLSGTVQCNLASDAQTIHMNLSGYYVNTFNFSKVVKEGSGVTDSWYVHYPLANKFYPTMTVYLPLLTR